MKINVIMFNQDDPKKCTALKLIKFNLIKRVKKTNHNSLILNPFSTKILLPNEKNIKSITAIDCSWKKINKPFSKKINGINRKLPPLFAGNPINYSKLSKLTTIESIAGALFILGNKELGLKLLNKFKWGHTFLELNRNLLKEYSKIKSEKCIKKILLDYNILKK